MLPCVLVSTRKVFGVSLYVASDELRETINFNREWAFHLVFERILLTAIADGLRSLPAARQSE